MLTVCCINWNDYEGQGKRYVHKLESMLARNLSVPHEFVCLTEEELGTDLKGWWCKIKLAEPGRFTGDVMYLDLDLAITANIDHLATLAATDRTKLWMREDFSYPYNPPREDLDPYTRKLLGGPGCCNSSVMLWHGDTLKPVWDDWQERSEYYLAERAGDQNVISPIMYPSRLRFLPRGSIQSFKYGIEMHRERPAPIVVFHGRPKITELDRKNELRQLWEAA